MGTKYLALAIAILGVIRLGISQEAVSSLNDPVPDRVILISPPNRGYSYSDSIVFVWHRGAPNVTNYWFKLAPDSLFEFSIFDSLLVDTTKKAVGYSSSMHYYWKVKARNTQGWGEFSEVWSFRIPTDGAPTSARPARFALEQNYPNPFNPSTTIRYGLPNRSHVTLTVFNTLGQQVAILQNGEQEAGYHEVQFYGSGLSSGVYFYRMQAGEFVQTLKLLLVR